VAVEEARKALVAKIGENIQVRRCVSGNSSGGVFGEYSHSGRIGVVCEIQGGDAELARDIAMHIAASKPICVDESGVPADVLEKEKAILKKGASVTSFHRLEVGEGIEKKEENFAEEVMAQVRGS